MPRIAVWEGNLSCAALNRIGKAPGDLRGDSKSLVSLDLPMNREEFGEEIVNSRRLFHSNIRCSRVCRRKVNPYVFQCVSRYLKALVQYFL